MKLVLSLLAFACVPAWSQAVKPALQPVRYALTQGQQGTVRVVPALLAGDYQGKLGPIPIRLHPRIVDGDLTGTLDGPDATGIRIDRIAAVGTLLTFRVPALRATWTGTVGHTLAGTWTQGEASAPLNLGRMQ